MFSTAGSQLVCSVICVVLCIYRYIQAAKLNNLIKALQLYRLGSQDTLVDRYTV